MKRRILPLLLCACIGCGRAASDDPPSSGDVLGRSYSFTEYDLRYWLTQAMQDKVAFGEAAHYCNDKPLAQYPNCRPVRQALLLTSDTTREEVMLRRLEVRLRVMEDSLRRELELLTNQPRP